MTAACNIKVFLAPNPDVLPWIAVCWFLANLALDLQLGMGIYVLREGTVRLFSAGI